MVGGISRTVDFRGCRFDIGGHRFFTKVPEVEALWREILGDDLLVRRSGCPASTTAAASSTTRCKPLNALRRPRRVRGGPGRWRATSRAQAFPLADESSFERG